MKKSMAEDMADMQSSDEELKRVSRRAHMEIEVIEVIERDFIFGAHGFTTIGEEVDDLINEAMKRNVNLGKLVIDLSEMKAS